MRTNAVDILGIGAQKSATSWAAHVLHLHPNVWIPQHIAFSGKEVMFWDRHYRKGLDWYRETMTPPEPFMKSMDITPGYSRMAPPRIKQCREQSPQARVFFLIRNPIYRDWSSLRMDAVRTKVDLKSASFVDLMVYYSQANIAQFSTYAQTITRWRNAYGEQLMVALYDEITADAHAFFEKLCDHVGLNPDDIPNWRRKIEKRIFEGPGIPLPDDMFEFLSRYHRPMVERLSELIGRDVTHWLEQRQPV